MVIDSQRLRALRTSKLRSIASSHFGVDDLDVRPFDDGAFAFDGHTAFALLEDSADQGLGPALAFSLQQGARELTVLASDHSGDLARQASYFNSDINVYANAGDEPSLASATEFVEMLPLDSSAERFRELLVTSGAEVVEEHGVLAGEVMGLEVARVVGLGDEAHLEVGVGRNDREAFSMLYQHMSADEALEKVVATVSEQRRAGAENHALNLMAVERWLRAILIQEPSLIGVTDLGAVAPIVKRPFVDSAGPSPAIGTDADGSQVVVVCSVGVDLSLVPLAADYFARSGATGQLWVVVPKRDVYKSTRSILDLLHHPCRVVEISDQWRELVGGSAAVI